MSNQQQESPGLWGRIKNALSSEQVSIPNPIPKAQEAWHEFRGTGRNNGLAQLDKSITVHQELAKSKSELRRLLSKSWTHQLSEMDALMKRLTGLGVDEHFTNEMRGVRKAYEQLLDDCVAYYGDTLE